MELGSSPLMMGVIETEAGLALFMRSPCVPAGYPPLLLGL